MTRAGSSMARFREAAAALALGIACSSSAPTDPTQRCTLIGCHDGLRVDLEPGSNWPAGDYRFVIHSDDVQVTCRGALPLPACSAGRAVSCEPAGVVTIVESGCALPASTHGFPQIIFDPQRRPKSVRVSIMRSQGGKESEVASAHLSPDYRTVQPNGHGCPPTCSQAEGRVRVRF
jgi:hypothetical protein